MQRKTSYYARQFFVAALAGAAGLVVGTQFETKLAPRSNPESYFVMQAYASDAFVKFATPPSPTTPDANGADCSRECGAGIENDCIYL